jgi:hypothetical protein
MRASRSGDLTSRANCGRGMDKADELFAVRPAQPCAARMERRRSGQELARPRERYLSTISCKMVGFAKGSTPIRAQTGRFGENRRWAARGQCDVIAPKPSKPCNETQSAKLIRVEDR